MLENLFNKCLQLIDIPADWENIIMILIYKRDQGKLSNYRLISLLLVLYKLFSKIIAGRLTNKLDQYQLKGAGGLQRGLQHLKPPPGDTNDDRKGNSTSMFGSHL